MGKTNTLLLLYLIFYLPWVNAQKEDYNWLFGIGDNPMDSMNCGAVINFDSDPPNVYYDFSPTGIDLSNTSVSDTFGNLLFYTNGIAIFNHLHQKLPSSDTLNPGTLSDQFYHFGYPLIQSVVFLQLPKNDNLYYLFHYRSLTTPDFPSPHVDGLYFTIVDKEMNGGTGGIVEKRSILLSDTLSIGLLTATKHANGVDWWIIAREYASQSYHKFLFNSEGVHYVSHQAIGVAPEGAEVLGQATFSPNGNKYARYGIPSGNPDVGNYVEVLDFNRCDGEFSNPVYLNIVDSAGLAGVAISPNSRFLYLMSDVYVYQYDFWAGSFESSKDTVAVFDGYQEGPFHARFFLGQLAPDGKIYISLPNNMYYLHVIHYPDLKGDSCMVEQRGITLPAKNSFSMPSYPNYRLGPMEGYPGSCEPVAVRGATEGDGGLVLYPNPAGDRIKCKV